MTMEETEEGRVSSSVILNLSCLAFILLSLLHPIHLILISPH